MQRKSTAKSAETLEANADSSSPYESEQSECTATIGESRRLKSWNCVRRWQRICRCTLVHAEEGRKTIMEALEVLTRGDPRQLQEPMRWQSSGIGWPPR